MISTVRGALSIVDAWTRRRVWVSWGLSLVMTAIEMAAFGLLYVLIRLLGDPAARTSSDYAVLRRLVGADEGQDLTPRLALAAVGLLLFKSAMFMAVARWQTAVQSDTEARLAARLFQDYVARDYLFHVERNSAALIRNLTASVGVVSNAVVGSLITALADGTVLLGIFVTFLLAEPGFALLIAGYLVIVVAGYLVVVSPVVHRAGLRDHELTQDMLMSMQEGFSGIKAVQVFDVTGEVADGYTRQRQRLARSRRVLMFVLRLPQYYLEICMVLGISVLTVFLLSTRTNEEAFALLGLLVAAALRVLPSVSRVLGGVNGIRSGGAAVDNLLREGAAGTLRTEPERDDAHGEIEPLRHDVRLDGVTFHYPRATAPALADVALRIRSGESVGIVGPSGSGKTTMVDLLLGLLTPTTGAVLVDGVPLRTATMGSWRRQVGYVPQETYLMDASVRANVVFHRRLGDADADDLVWAALQTAQLADFVRGLPDQLDTLVGERGARLSGGQRQRLGIARALLLSPAVLVLDEATSALDAPTESAITETINLLQGRVTLVTIAHRLSTVRACDRIVLLEAGRLADEGPFDELLARNAHFADLVRRANVVTGPA